MRYRVVMDGNDILNYDDKRFALLSPSLDAELNAAGSFEFIMPPGHAFYDAVHPLRSTIEVYEDDVLLWFGRPVETKVDFCNQRQVYCEGALAFFNDSIQRLCEYGGETLSDFFRAVIAAHNTQVAPERQFAVGTISMPSKFIYRKTNYESTLDVLKRQCIGAEGGYLFLRRENGVNYIDWMADMPFVCNQPVEFGLNLLNMSSGFDGSSIATCIIPLGDTVEETGAPLTVASVNSGSDMIDSDAALTYGRITKAVTFSGVKNADELYADGVEYLRDKQFDNLTIECSAADLHAQNENYDAFRVGQMVRCHSVPHLVDKRLPLMKISIRLDTAAKQITLGTAEKQSLTRIYKDVQEMTEDPASQEELEDIKDEIEDLWDAVEELQDGSNEDDPSGEDEPGGHHGSDHWIHQINGVTLKNGTINFITEVHGGAG